MGPWGSWSKIAEKFASIRVFSCLDASSKKTAKGTLRGRNKKKKGAISGASWSGKRDSNNDPYLFDFQYITIQNITKWVILV